MRQRTIAISHVSMQSGLMKIARIASPLSLLLTASCGMLQPSPGLGVTDGCYYAGATPVLRVKSLHGTFLIPGTVREVRITPQKNDASGVTAAMFEPGFELKTSPRLETITPTDMRERIFLMMESGASVPTIMASSEPMGLVFLARGAAC